MPGVLVTDFYAADHGIDCITQKCLAHLLCELHTLRDEATAAAKDDYLQPLRTLLQDAIDLGKTRAANPADFEAARNQLDKRLGSLIYSRPKDHDCNRINKRLVKHRFDLRLFLKVAGVPPPTTTSANAIFAAWPRPAPMAASTARSPVPPPSPT